MNREKNATVKKSTEMDEAGLYEPAAPRKETLTPPMALFQISNIERPDAPVPPVNKLKMAEIKNRKKTNSDMEETSSQENPSDTITISL